MSSPTEQLVEDVASVYFGAIGAATKRGVEIDDAGERGDASQVTLKGRLAAALHRLNLDLPHDSIEEVVRILSRPPHPTLIQNNRWFHSLLTDGVEVEYREAKSGETRGGRARLVDFDNPAANELLVVRQLTATGASGKVIRPDLTVFLNGLPVAVIELKDPTDTQADLGVAHRPARPLHADRPRPVRVEPGAGGVGRHADPRRLDHQRAQPLHALAPDRRP